VPFNRRLADLCSTNPKGQTVPWCVVPSSAHLGQSLSSEVVGTMEGGGRRPVVALVVYEPCDQQSTLAGDYVALRTQIEKHMAVTAAPAFANGKQKMNGGS
jgi:hypothetical protein